jgi:transcriptional regulator with XRE-family HTH domain
MAKPFRALLDPMPPTRRARGADRAEGMRLEMALQELRQRRHLTQCQLADALQLHQAAISRMEGQSDMHLGTLRRLVTALGGRLILVAQFPDEEIVINQFEAGG